MVAQPNTLDVAEKYLTATVTTSKAGTTTTPFDCGNRIVDTLSVRWYAGHANLVGVRINYSGVTIVPWNQPTAFVFGEDERLNFDVGLYVAGPLSVVVNNTGAYQHTLQVIAAVHEWTTAPTEVAPIPLLALT